jgi:putative tRNA adenosine deaminase-associated protein
VSYFAAAVVRGTTGWSASELSLKGAADVEDVADRLRDVDPDADISLLFVESDDTYLVILRLDQGDDLRVFGSDSAFAAESRVGAILLGEIDVEAPVIELDAVDDDDTEPDKDVADADPAGDSELLADLGLSGARLLELCAQEGMLPADVTAEVCQILGCGDEVEELREA